MNGGDKDWTDSPYPRLGRQAFDAAASNFTLGTAGAGYGAMTGSLKGGLGSASCVLPSGHTVGALVVVNALGQATVGETPHFWAAPFEEGTEFGGLGPAPMVPQHAPLPRKRLGEATRLPVELHDERLTSVEAESMLRERGWSLKKLLEEKKKGAVDRLAAILLLEDWLSARRTGQGTGR